VATGRAAPAAALAALLVTLLAGCAAAPTRIAGDPAPLTASGSASLPANASGASPTSPPSTSPASTASPIVPPSYTPFRLSGAGVTISVPVPTGWQRSGNATRVDFRDATGQILLRVELQQRMASTARQAWEAADRNARATFQGYRLLGITDVPGVGDSAADWRFSFERDGVRRRVVDRGILSGDAGLAVYYSAPEPHYRRLAPVWDTAIAGLSIT
jgi:hypothetical protein